jgi:hypothetical protein
MATDRYDHVEGSVGEVIDMIGCLRTDIHAGLGHDLDSVWIQPVRRNAGGAGGKRVALEMPRPAFGHLASA